MQAREAERPLRDAQAGALHAPAHRSAEPAEVLTPVPGGPDLVPVDDDQVPAEPTRERRREQGEVREGRGVDDVVASSATEEVPEHAGSEDERRQQPSPASCGVEAHTGARGDDANARNVGLVTAIPLPERQERHVVAARRERLREVSIPALRSADRVRVQAVVDDADLHAPYPSRRRGRRRLRSPRRVACPWSSPASTRRRRSPSA